MYKFCLSIGDWSGDGHGIHKDFIVLSNMPVEVVREAHYKIENETGIRIEEICSEYEEDEIGAEDVRILKELGFEFENSTGMGEGVVNPTEMARLWLFLLQKVNPMLKLEIVQNDAPSFHFFGFDAHGRHIGFVGYGLFS